MHSLFFLIISPLLPLRVVAAAPLWAAPWRATNHSHQARTVRQHPLSTSLSLSHTASCSPVIFLSLHPPVKPPLKAYLINALTIFAIFVIQLNRIHFTVCTFDSKRTEQSEFRAKDWKRRAHNSLIWHERWHLPKWQARRMSLVAIAGLGVPCRDLPTIRLLLRTLNSKWQFSVF